MKKGIKYKIFIAWVMLVSIMPFFIVKATHYHEDHASCKSTDSHSHSKPNKCLICHFALSPFTEAQSIEIEPITTDYISIIVNYII